MGRDWGLLTISINVGANIKCRCASCFHSNLTTAPSADLLSRPLPLCFFAFMIGLSGLDFTPVVAEQDPYLVPPGERSAQDLLF